MNLYPGIQIGGLDNKFISLLESIPNVCLILSPAGQITFVNERAEKLFGYKRENLLDFNIEKLIPGCIPAPLFFELSDKPSDKTVDFTAFHKNGKEFNVEITANLLEIDDTICFAVYISDITEKKKHEKDIQELAAIISSSSDAIISKTLDGKILTWNRGAENILGYTFEEIKGKHISILFPPELLAEEASLLAKIQSGESVEQYETVRLRKDKQRINVSITLSAIKSGNGNILGISKVLRDITNRKKAELQLQESNERNKIFIQQAPTAIAMFDKTMIYLAASEKWAEQYALQGTEIIGRSHYEVFPEIGEDWKAIHEACLKGEINQCQGAPFERADGTVQWISWDARPWYIAPNEIGGLLIYTADITLIKEKDRDKRRIEEILDKTNEVARIGTWEVDLTSNSIYWSRITREIHEVETGYIPELASAINFF
jgi:PAS domain S-box-containing protein